MSCSDSILSSAAGEKRSLEEKGKSAPVEYLVDIIDFDHIDIHPCVFRVPKSLTVTKPEAYAPQKVGLGPYHHLRPDLYTMQRKKLADVLRFLSARVRLRQDFQNVIERFTQQEQEYLTRASYDEYLDLDRLALARVVAIDAIYLLNHIGQISSSSAAAEDVTPDTKKKLAADILMLENQIPGKFLLKIQGILSFANDRAFFKDIHSFCEEESPLELMEKHFIRILPLMRQGHLLSVMYDLILPRSERENENKAKPHKACRVKPSVKETVKLAAETEAAIGAAKKRTTQKKAKLAAEMAVAIGIPGAAIVQKELAVVDQVPWELMLDNLKKYDPDHKENSPGDEIDIPSVSNLTRYAGIIFAPTDKGIRGARFELGEKKLYLPKITLRSNSEVNLRNLLAYEAASVKAGSPLELAEYVDLMCGLVNTPEDVKSLRKAKIINGDLPNEEIAGIFNGILRSTGAKDKGKEQRNIEQAIEEVNKLYGSVTRVKTTRFVKKYCSISWQILGIIVSVMVFMLLALQAFCLIYDCRSHWSVKSKYNPLQVL